MPTEFLAERDINVPAGSFYAIEASRFLGLGDAGGLRVGLAPYSSRSDVDRLLEPADRVHPMSIDPTGSTSSSIRSGNTWSASPRTA